ncbi:MAG: type I-U CRISPR-associated protein Cas5/Cas6 [Planctomycetaceae bacterium]|nr:type I-U CRISPR-associated protein Cas5/Cas6 [Planctomycetaceae bacterium]
MNSSLLISVRLHEGWYHGAGDTPSPARMFQALVAGAGLGGPLDQETRESLRWLEMRKEPPIVGAPHTTKGQSFVNFVPNNDLDAKQGDHRRIGDIRTKKVIAPLLFDEEIPFLFAWKLSAVDDAQSAEQVCRLADRVYQLGRAVDLAWAWGEVLPHDELEERLNYYPGIVRYPSVGTGTVDCPTTGSLDSLIRRHAAAAERFDLSSDGKGQTFRRRPKPKWKKVSYQGGGSRFVVELRQTDKDAFAPWPLDRSTQLVETVRDVVAERLRGALQDRVVQIDQCLIGRRPNGENAGPTAARVRFIPLPSIGHSQADMQIRRVLIDIPAECPLRVDDLLWAVSGVRIPHSQFDVVDITTSSDEGQLEHFGVSRPARVWRTVTPAALPAERRRIDPQRVRSDDSEKKSASERSTEQARAAAATAQALRHGGITTDVNSIRVQREPFDQRGSRVEGFAAGTRFDKHRLWHVELEFDSPVSGPVVLGDGRFLGLGVMRPVSSAAGVFAFSIDSGLAAEPDAERLAKALRRAVMARVRDVLGTHRIGTYFSGHGEDGSPGRTEDAPHLAFVFDPLSRQLLVLTPQLFDKRHGPRATDNLATLESALEGFHELRAGVDGHLRIRPAPIDANSHGLFAASTVWQSTTPYCVNRHARRSSADVVLTRDVLADCERRGLPRPDVVVLKWNAPRGVGLQGWLRLKFSQSIVGPILLGRTRHLGGGVFRSDRSESGDSC